MAVSTWAPCLATVEMWPRMAYRSRVPCSERSRPEIFCWVLAGRRSRSAAWAAGMAAGYIVRAVIGRPAWITRLRRDAVERAAAAVEDGRGEATTIPGHTLDDDTDLARIIGGQRDGGSKGQR